MQAKKVRVASRPASKKELEGLEKFLQLIGASSLFDSKYIIALDVEEGDYVELFYIDSRLYKVVVSLGAMYSGGLNLGLVDRRSGTFKPSLHLARELALLCRGFIIKCSVLTPRGEALFLYGKSVYEENIVRWVRGVSLVVGVDYEPLGWGLGEEVRDERIIKPIRDLGWYLRKGG